jgi:hypothetical protein
VRLFLDAHISGRVIAEALRERGHDVRAADEERVLDGWDDERLLELAAGEERIMVTFNVRDFARIVGEWAAAGRHHAGCLMIVRLDHRDFGAILRVIDAALATRPEQAGWRDYAAWASPARPRAEESMRDPRSAETPIGCPDRLTAPQLGCRPWLLSVLSLSGLHAPPSGHGPHR